MVLGNPTSTSIPQVDGLSTDPLVLGRHTISRVQNNMYNGKFKHIRRRHNIIRQILSTEVMSLDYVKSKDKIADPLTKGLNRELVEKSSNGIRLKPVKE